MLKRCLYLLMVLWLSIGAVAAADNIKVINTRTYNKILNYLLISPSDVSLYKKIFAEQADGDWKKANRLTGKLENNIILGHVLAEQYLSPEYTSNYPELKAWLEQYYDLPQAQKIYQLAGRKGGFSDLTPPSNQANQSLIRGWNNLDLASHSAAEKRYLVTQVTRFRKALNSGKTKAARQVLEQPQFRRLAPNKYWDEMAASLAMKYLVDNYNQLALQWSVKASGRQTSGVGPWVAGLASWQMKNYAQAAQYFSQLARSKNEDAWLVSAGGYWAYRSYSRLNNKFQADKMLHQAARYKHTLYGILATYKAGLRLDYNWDSTAYLNDFDNNDYVYDLLASPAIRRSIILIHAKRRDLAEAELRHAYQKMTPKQQEATIYIANQYNMHSLAIYACKQTEGDRSGRQYNRVAYPVPEYFSRGSWRVDKALVLALIRQESAFKPEARSPAGARGLMQLMPNTAYHITKDIAIKINSSRLLDAEYNLDLGQRYVEYLLSKPFIEGNLFYMATAYNAGPGNLVKWKKTSHYNDDPLLFIEIIPSAETRIYIERVIANYWIYNSRFDLANPTLKQVAAGNWPILSRD